MGGPGHIPRQFRTMKSGLEIVGALPYSPILGRAAAGPKSGRSLPLTRRSTIGRALHGRPWFTSGLSNLEGRASTARQVDRRVGSRLACSALAPMDPQSPAGCLSTLEASTSSPTDALVFRRAAHTVRVLCEARVQQATAMAAIGLADSLAAAGVEDVEAKSGFALTKNSDGVVSATAHMWVQVGGRIVDVCYNTTYIFEDARRGGIDLSDVELVRSKVGSRITPLLVGILKRKRKLRLSVLGETVDIGPDAWPEDDCTTLTTEVPADDVEGMSEAGPMRRGFEDILNNEEVRKFWLDGMPPEYRTMFADLGGTTA